MVLAQQKVKGLRVARLRGKTTERASKRSPQRKPSGGTPTRVGAGRSGTFSLYNSQRERSKDDISSLLSQQSRASKATRYNDGVRPMSNRNSGQLLQGPPDEVDEAPVESLIVFEKQ